MPFLRKWRQSAPRQPNRPHCGPTGCFQCHMCPFCLRPASKGPLGAGSALNPCVRDISGYRHRLSRLTAVVAVAACPCARHRVNVRVEVPCRITDEAGGIFPFFFFFSPRGIFLDAPAL